MIIILLSSAFANVPLPSQETEQAPSIPETAAPIINGEDAEADDFPATGGMLMDATIEIFGDTQELRSFICSSTLIAPDVVVLAAHCIDEAGLTMGFGEVEDMEIRWTRQPDLSSLDGSSANADWPADSIVAWDWVAHPNFSMDGIGLGINQGEDIALLFLDEPVLDIDHAFLATQSQGLALAEGDEVMVVGWGQQIATSMWESSPPGSYAYKQMGVSNIGDIGEYEFQVGVLESDVRKCHGDSGGPSFKSIDGEYRLVGVTSHAYDQNDCFETGGVDTRIDPYLEWIESEMVKRCEDGTRSWCDVEGIVTPEYYQELALAELEEEQEQEDKGACSTATITDLSWMLSLSALTFVGWRRRNHLGLR
jgi:hypothetical protein